MEEHSLSLLAIKATSYQKAICYYEQDKLLAALLYRLIWGVMHIDHLYVDYRWRNRGWGSTLLRDAIELAVASECPFIMSMTENPRAFSILFVNQG